MPLAVKPTALRLPARPALPVAVSVALAGLALFALMRLGLIAHGRPLPLGFSIPLLAFVWLRRKGLLWCTALCYMAISAIEKFVVFTAIAKFGTIDDRVVDFILFIINILILTGVLHLFITLVDDTERKSRLLSRSNAELAAVWRTAPVGLCISDGPQADVRFNPHGAAMLGVLPDENMASAVASGRIGLSRDGLVIPINQGPLSRAARENVYIEPAEWELSGPTGRRVTVLLAAAPVRLSDDGDGLNPVAASGAVAAFVDISAVKQLQRELDLRRREAEEASVRKSRFLSAVSHDIRTPANAISLLAELLRHASTNPSMTGDIPKFASDLRASAQKLVELVSDVLDFTKMDTARIELVETVFDLNDMLSEEITQASVVASEKNLPIHLTPAPDRPSIRTDRVKLGRILGNLLSNAVKFTQSGEVRISTSRNAAGDVLIHIADTGPGIEPDAMDRIFDEFYQVRTNSTSRDPLRVGSGLGLAICRRLTVAMGLRLDVQSKLGQGTTFTLTIPQPLTMLSAREA